MLKFYYNPLSPNARRVWLTLLEKGIDFEPILVKLNGDQLEPDFTAVNPFHHIPAIVDNDFRVIESLAILDYLEHKYPTPAMLPTQAEALAKVRMIQMVTANELFPQVISLIFESETSSLFKQAEQQTAKILRFFGEYLDQPYFGSQNLTLADIVAGTAVSLLPHLGISLSSYSKLDDWHQRLMQREAWQKTQLSAADFTAFKRRVKALVKLHRRELSQKNEETGNFYL